MTSKVWDKQHGGSHYQKYKIQPSKFVVENELLYPEGCAIKYIIRHRDKNGKEDIFEYTNTEEELTEERMYNLEEFGYDKNIPWYDEFTSDYEECLYIREMLSNGEDLRKNPRVKLSTIHSAKGGEADNVLLILDNTKTIRDALEKSSDKQDEEHRVWYVGVTRTKQNLYIMAAKKEDQGYDIESLG
jgi:superfamily I DNA/RNA helicase